MFPDRYFDKFPVIEYSNNQVVDITKRVTLLDKVSRNPYIFYPFDLSGQERADQFSNRYYEDSYKSWILYLTNKITDPYYEWYLSETEFYEFIEKKYGSVIDSQQKIKFYRNDWENKETIEISAYNALTDNLKKYWEPNYLNSNKLVNYVRKKIDWSSTTNKIVSYAVNNGNNFIKDEICEVNIKSGEVGKGQVVFSTSNKVYLQHVYGTFYTSETVMLNQNSYIYGTESNSNVTISAVSSVSNNITEEELVYWKPITYFDYEYEKNEYNKSIKVMDKDYSYTAVDNLRELLEE